MLIQEIVAKTGLSRDTIRYYEKEGLIRKDKKGRKESYFKDYSDHDLKGLHLIQLMKEYGFTLSEIKEFLAEAKENGNTAFHKMEGKVSKRINEINKKLSELLIYKKRLIALKKNL